MHARLQFFLDAVENGEFSNDHVREALPVAIKLCDALLGRLFAEDASEDDLCMVIIYASDAHARIAAERLLTDPRAYLSETTLRCILAFVPEHADEAARQILVRKDPPSRKALVKIITYSNGHAHEAATRLLADAPKDDELGLIVARVPELAGQACEHLGAFGGLPAELPSA